MSHLAQQKVVYLGYVISSFGISADTSKVEAVNSFPVPKSLKQLHSFVGLASQFRQFIQGFSRIASPLLMPTKKDAPYVWSSDCQKAFDKLKDCLTKAPVFAFLNFAERFILETNASGLGLRAVLFQKQLDGKVAPIAYASLTHCCCLGCLTF